MFWIGSLSSISLATDTPSLVIDGAPNFLLMITFLPLGPNVTLTALANASTPSLSFALASTSKEMSFAMLFVFLEFFLKKLNELDNTYDIAFSHD